MGRTVSRICSLIRHTIPPVTLSHDEQLYVLISAIGQNCESAIQLNVISSRGQMKSLKIARILHIFTTRPP